MGLKKEQKQKTKKVESIEQEKKIRTRYMSQKTINRLKQLYQDPEYLIREFGGMVVN